MPLVIARLTAGANAANNIAAMANQAWRRRRKRFIELRQSPKKEIDERDLT
ncbi:hypothetical protein MASR2M16_19850 [Thauera terpenica]